MTATTNNTNFRENLYRYNKYFKKISDSYASKPETKNGINVLLSATLIVFFALFALRPTIITIADLLSKIKTQNEISTQLNTKINNLQKAKNVWTQEQNNIALLNQAFPKTAQPVQFLQLVEGFIAKHDLTIDSLTLDNIAVFGETVTKSDGVKGKVDNTNSIKVSISVHGKYDNLMAFLKDSENLRRIIEFTSVTFGDTRDTNTSGNLSLTILGNTSYLRKE